MVSLWPWTSGKSKPQTPPEPTATPSTPPPSATPNMPTTPGSWWPWGTQAKESTNVYPDLFASDDVTRQQLLTGLRGEYEALITAFDSAILSWTRSPTEIALASAAIGGLSAVGLGIVYGRYGKRLQNIHWITPDWLGGKRWIRGVVTRVGDGDNFRIFHTPTFGGYHWPLKLRSVPTKRAALTLKETIPIRIAGVDAPENAHFGAEAQHYAPESLEWLRNQLLNRKVYCQLVDKDQYSRVVANVYRAWPLVPGFIFRGTNMSKKMLLTGNAVVYEQAGAVYGGYSVEQFKKWEDKARKKRVGQWAKRSAGHRESPAEYKKRHAKATEA